MELLWWLVAVILFAVGLIGTVLPVFPGTIIILAGALLHRMMLGPEKSVGWGTITILVLLTMVAYALDFLSGYFGARYFGATKWGMFGALLGAVVGIFFGVAAGRLGKFAGKSRCDDWQTFYRARDDRDFLHDGAASVLIGVMSSGVETSLISHTIPARMRLITANEGWFSLSGFHPPPIFGSLFFLAVCDKLLPMADDRW